MDGLKSSTEFEDSAIPAGADGVFSSNGDPSLDIEPPVLPPKPQFARSSVLERPEPPPLPPKAHVASLNPPPPLPPKPEKARALQESDPHLFYRHAFPSITSSGLPEKEDSSTGSQTMPSLPIPSRPLPPIPESRVVEEHDTPNVGVNRLGKELEKTQSFEHSYSNGALSRRDGSGNDDPTELATSFYPPDRSSISATAETLNYTENDEEARGTLSEILAEDQAKVIEVPVPPPLANLGTYGVAKAYGAFTYQDDSTGDGQVFCLSPDAGDDVLSGAAAITRVRSKGSSIFQRQHGFPMLCSWYRGAKAGDELWLLMNEVVSKRKIPSDGWEKAMLLLVGVIVKATIDDYATARGQLTDVVAHLCHSTDPLRRGSTFTLLINIAAHATFVYSSCAHLLEKLTAEVLSAAILGMEKTERDPNVWDKASRCALLLSSCNLDVVRLGVSPRAFIILASHVTSDKHPDIIQLLFQNVFRVEESIPENTAGNNSSSASLWQSSGNVEDIVRLYVTASSLVTKRRMFRAIYDAAVEQVVNTQGVASDLDIDQHSKWLYALLHAYNAADAMVVCFRQGTDSDYAMDLLRQIFFLPLMKPRVRLRIESNIPDNNNVLSDALGVVYRGFADHSSRGDKDSLTKAHVLGIARHAQAIRVANRLLDKSFTIRVLMELQNIANIFAGKGCPLSLGINESEKEVLKDAEILLLGLRRSASKSSTHATARVLQALYAAAAGLVTLDASPGAATRLTEIVLDSLLLEPAFCSPSSSASGTELHNSKASLFLAGKLIAIRGMIVRTNPNLFISLLRLTRCVWYKRYISELRQSLTELTGLLQERAELLAEFTNDPDAAVAYRASVIFGLYGAAPPH